MLWAIKMIFKTLFDRFMWALVVCFLVSNAFALDGTLIVANRTGGSISFIDLNDKIKIKKIEQANHRVMFQGKFSKKIYKNNTVTELLNILDKQNLINNQKYQIIINKKIPSKAGLGGGSMNASAILNYLLK